MSGHNHPSTSPTQPPTQHRKKQTHDATEKKTQPSSSLSLSLSRVKKQKTGLKEDLGRILDVVDALGVPILTVPGVEADDVIGTLAARGAAAGMDVTIVSPDKVRSVNVFKCLRACALFEVRSGRVWPHALILSISSHTHILTAHQPTRTNQQDFFQLLGPRVRLMRMIKAPKKASLRPGSSYYTSEDFDAEHDLGPGNARLWADALALMGDDADGVPGVRGVGPKTALRLVRACGGLEGALAAAEGGEWPEGVKLNKAQKAALGGEDGRAAARLAKELVTIVTDLEQPAVT